VAIEVKFCTGKRTHVPVGPAKFDANRCNELPLRGEKPAFWPVSKFNTGSLPLRGILPVINLSRWREIAVGYLSLARPVDEACLCLLLSTYLYPYLYFRLYMF